MGARIFLINSGRGQSQTTSLIVFFEPKLHFLNKERGLWVVMEESQGGPGTEPESFFSGAALIFLSLLFLELLAFFLCKKFLVFFEHFPFFPGIFGVRLARKSLFFR